MKFKLLLCMAAAVSLTACSTSSKLKLPPSTPASVPASADTAPVEKVAPLPDNSMGSLAVGYAALLKQYGTLAVRFITQRQFEDCVRTEVNSHKTADSCR